MDWIRLGASGKDLTGVGAAAGHLSVSCILNDVKRVKLTSTQFYIINCEYVELLVLSVVLYEVISDNKLNFSFYLSSELYKHRL